MSPDQSACPLRSTNATAPASHRGTSPSEAAKWGAPLHQLTSRPPPSPPRRSATSRPTSLTPRPAIARSSRPGLAGPQYQWPGHSRPRTHLCMQSGLPLSTPSGCSSRSSGGRPRRSASPPPPTAGPGSSSPSTPSCASPDRSLRTCARPGNGPPSRGGSPRPGSAAGSGTSTRPCPAWPVRRNPASLGPDARQDPRTAIRRPATTWGKTTKRDGTLKAQRERAG